MQRIKRVQCTHVIAQVAVGCFDEEEHLIGEELFPQVDGRPIPARIFHPHPEQLQHLIAACEAQACQKLSSLPQEEPQPARACPGGAELAAATNGG